MTDLRPHLEWALQALADETRPDHYADHKAAARAALAATPPAERPSCNHFPGQTECEWCRATPPAEGLRKGTVSRRPGLDLTGYATPPTEGLDEHGYVACPHGGCNLPANHATPPTEGLDVERLVTAFDRAGWHLNGTDYDVLVRAVREYAALTESPAEET